MYEYELRVHHVFNFLKYNSDDFEKYRSNMTGLDSFREDKPKRFSDEDIEKRIVFYRFLIKNPETQILVTRDIDYICEMCSNYRGEGCSLYSREQLQWEDNRTYRDIIPGVRVGQPIFVRELLKTPVILPQIPIYVFLENIAFNITGMIFSNSKL